jgi:metallo-beta-lactamase class B
VLRRERWFFFLLLAAGPRPASAQDDSVSRSWNQPIPPFKLLGNVYYVGASDVTSFLIVTPRGLILIDGGFVETAPQILGNLAALGYQPSDVKLLLNSHAHFDHAGGLSQLKRVTGARLVAGKADSALLAAGGHGDFFFRDRFPFPPVTVDRSVRDGDRMELGGTVLTAHATPGHTKGCTTWSTAVQEGGRTYAVLFVCSLAIPGYPLRAIAEYPTIAEDYQSSIDKVRSLPCDVLLGPHGSMFGLMGKMARGRPHRPSPFVDPVACRAHLDRAEEDLHRRLGIER